MSSEAQIVASLLQAENLPEDQIEMLLSEGYDTRNVIETLTVSSMEDLGLKKGHISKIKLVQSKLAMQKSTIGSMNGSSSKKSSTQYNHESASSIYQNGLGTSTSSSNSSNINSNLNSMSMNDIGAAILPPLDYIRKSVASFVPPTFFSDQPLCRFCSDSWASPVPVTSNMMMNDKRRGGAPGGGGKLAQTTSSISSGVRQTQSSTDYVCRTPEEIEELVNIWERYAHPRARSFFSNDEKMLHQVLSQIARGVDCDDDPILADSERCVIWWGDITNEDEAAIKMLKPGESKESITYVNRVLAFLFATDESFVKLMSLPKSPFKMCCGNQLCVNLSHISSSPE